MSDKPRCPLCGKLVEMQTQMFDGEGLPAALPCGMCQRRLKELVRPVDIAVEDDKRGGT